MSPKLIRLFIATSFVILLVTGLAKIVSAAGDARILQTFDPIFGIQFRTLFWIVGPLEILVALVCLLGRQTVIQASCILWIATGFLAYRLGLIYVGYKQSCSCLGNLTNALHIPPDAADLAMKIALGYLFIGSSAVLLLTFKRKAKTDPAAANPIAPPVG